MCRDKADQENLYDLELWDSSDSEQYANCINHLNNVADAFSSIDESKMLHFSWDDKDYEETYLKLEDTDGNSNLSSDKQNNAERDFNETLKDIGYNIGDEDE